MTKLQDLSGKRFGRLVAIKYSKSIRLDSGKWSTGSWKCICDCGKFTEVEGGNLKSNGIQSCGCLKKEIQTTHGLAKIGNPSYRAWTAMKTRCLNKKDRSYHRYGGRGISVCKRWMKFENFYKDMGERPSKDYSIDRINNSKGYSPGNCRWATRIEQMRNTRQTKLNPEIVKKIRRLQGDGFKSWTIA